MEWYFILVLVLAIPFILLPVGLVWYLNVSGLYQVIRDVRQRQKRRARREEAVKEAERLIRGKVPVTTATEQKAFAGRGKRQIG